MSLKQALAANRWLRAQFACLIAVVLCLPAMVVFTSAWAFMAFVAFVAFAVVGGACWLPAHRLDEALEAARVKDAAEAAELRTPRAPDAGPDQCPVCGGYGLTELAADDAFMERGDRAKVVPWGRKRAHRDCAEFVPYVAPPHFERVDVEGHRVYCVCSKCERATTNPGARRWCKFCGFYRWAESAEAAREELIVHAQKCPERRPTIGEFRAESANVDALIAGVEMRVRRIQSAMDSYLRPNLKGRRR